MLRVRLILWYSLLVFLTISAIGLFQYYRIEQSLFEALNGSLVDDAGTTLKLVSTLPQAESRVLNIMHGEAQATNALEFRADKSALPNFENRPQQGRTPSRYQRTPQGNSTGAPR